MGHLKRVGSLWVMINKVDSANLLAAFGQLKALLRALHPKIDEGKAEGPNWRTTMSDFEKAYAIKALLAIRKEAVNLGLQGIPTACDATGQIIDDNGKFDIDSLQLFQSQLNNIVQQIPYALSECEIFMLNSESALLLAEEHPFGVIVSDAFPSALYDIQEAARCRAYERWTASVLHLMRALEKPIKVLQEKVEVENPKDQWENIINEIESKIKKMNKSNSSSEDVQWYSEVAAHFRIIKNAWRNYAMHGRDTYDEQRASTIYESVRSFMQVLATRLTE